ncbi:MAG: hypothetical protein FJY56_14010 [Betaproteobacteria bacterium]|nr:hypothetical protein [Betaproteobacteria bacterium]
MKLAPLNIAATVACGIFATQALAQKYPSRPVRMVVPWSAGSQTDWLGRLVQPKLADSLGQPIIIDNRPGAGSTVGATMVAAATPDGHTLMMQAAAHAVSPALYTKLPYDAVNDFGCISRVGSVPNVLVVAPSLGLTSIKELIAHGGTRRGAALVDAGEV